VEGEKETKDERRKIMRERREELQTCLKPEVIYIQWAFTTSTLCYSSLSRKVVGSSHDQVDFFNLPNSSSRTVALGSTQPLREMSARNLPGR
jgi:hypothetical protein